MRTVFLILLFSLLPSALQATPTALRLEAPADGPVGTWEGTLNLGPSSLRLVLHVAEGDSGLTAALDSPDQGATGIPASTVTFADATLRVEVSSIQGVYEGTLAGDRLTGTWTQGAQAFPLNLTRRGAAPAPDVLPEALIGTWNGRLMSGGEGLPLVLHFHADGTATLDSPAQGVRGLAVADVVLDGDRLSLRVPAVGGAYAATFDGQALDGTWTQGPIAAPLRLTPGTPDAPKRPQHPAPPYPYDAEEVQFDGGAEGVTLAGTLTVPRTPGPHPAVVLLSGSGPQDRDETLLGHKPFLVLADHLTRQGIAVLRYDDRGTAASTGAFGTATSQDFADDAWAAMQFLQGHDAIDAGRIGLVGHSEGGLVAPLVAVAHDEVAFLVLLAGPGVPGSDIILDQSARIARAGGGDEATIARSRDVMRQAFAILKTHALPDDAAPKLTDLARATFDALTEEERAAEGLTRDRLDQQMQQLNSPWFRFFLSHDPAAVLRKVPQPVLAVNGEKDLQVSPAMNLEAIEAALRTGGNTAFIVEELPGLNHLFQTAETGAPSEYAAIEETFAPAALQVVSDWILSVMQ